MTKLTLLLVLLLLMFQLSSTFINRYVNNLKRYVKPSIVLYSSSIQDSRQSSSKRGRTSTSSSSSSSKGKQDYRRRESSNKNYNNRRDENQDKNVTNYVYNKNDGKTVVLQASKSNLFKDGNPIIYSGAIKNIYGEPVGGDYVEVRDYRGNPIGKGFYNPYSQYRIRLLSRSTETNYNDDLDTILNERIRNSINLRKSINIPSDNTDVYRLINGEGDRLGGLIVDVIGSYIIIQSSALWVESYQKTINSCIQKNFPQGKVLWRRVESRLLADGYGQDLNNNNDNDNNNTNDDNNDDDNEVNDLDENDDTVHSNNAESIIVKENNIKYMVYPTEGQKTGFYCDQRDNRQMINSICKDKEVLDCYCYSGGFALAALLGNAKKVIAVDSSGPALELAKQNLVLNKVEDRAELVKADALDYMKNVYDDGQSFDIVITDPPKLAPSRASLYKAKNKYIKINTAAMRLVKPGGLLVTCSCSAAVTQSGEFVSFLLEASKVAKRDITILSTTGAGQDHPIHIAYPEGRYLTCVVCSVA